LVIAGLFGVSPVRVPGLPDTAVQPAQVQQPAATPDGSLVSDATRAPTPGTRLAPTGPVGPIATTTSPAHPRGGPSRTHPSPTKPA
jgi:hypothetical protein